MSTILRGFMIVWLFILFINLATVLLYPDLRLAMGSSHRQNGIDLEKIHKANFN